MVGVWGCSGSQSLRGSRGQKCFGVFMAWSFWGLKGALEQLEKPGVGVCAEHVRQPLLPDAAEDQSDGLRKAPGVTSPAVSKRVDFARSLWENTSYPRNASCAPLGQTRNHEP